MLRLNIEELINNDAINKVTFNNEWLFDIDSVAEYIKEDLSNVVSITLPFNGEYKKAATLKNIEAGRKQESLSEFNQALLKMKKGNKDSHNY